MFETSMNGYVNGRRTNWMVRYLAFLMVVWSVCVLISCFGPALAQGVERETKTLRVRDLG